MNYNNFEFLFKLGSQGVIVVFDLTDISTFKNLDGWLEEIKKYTKFSFFFFLISFLSFQ